MDRSIGVLALAILSVIGPLTAPAAAGPLAPSEVPEPLKPWVDWVLRGHEAERCPFLNGVRESRTCSWPARLELELGDRSGSFTQHWLVYDETLVPLPGDAKRWPQDVRANDRPVAVISVAALQGGPGVRLGPGSHVLTGSFEWDALPELLPIPPQTGIIGLSLRGKPVAFPNRDAQGQLWLQKRARPEAAAESRIAVDVHRRAADEIPLLLSTRVQLDVSGPSREIVLGRALPEGFVPLSLVGPLPARLDPDGRLRVQARPGTWHLSIEARHEGPLSELVLPAQDDEVAPWDPSEVWVFDARPNLRVVTVEDGIPVDPGQTALPGDWRHLPAYLMEPGRALRLVEKRRGDQDPAPDALNLARTWWLDFDGRGYTVSDRIEGVIRRSTRLEMGAATRLGRVALNGRDQFITRLGEAESVGIEVPQGAIRLAADSRVEGDGGALPAVGWDQDFQSLEGQLHLPPGWRLFHASGVDRATWTWLNRWTLLDLFVALVIGMVFFRLWGPVWGALALITLALTYTEGGAPTWAWLAVVVGEALRRVLPEGRFARAVQLYWGLALAMLVLIAIPFGVNQVRRGMYPALERPWSVARFEFAQAKPDQQPMRAGIAGKAMLSVEEEVLPAETEFYVDDLARAPVPSTVQTQQVFQPELRRSRGRSYSYQYEPDPTARITTGPGLPTWQWWSVDLHWSGPVQRSQELHLYLFPPWLNRLLAFARVTLLTVLVLCVLGTPLAAAAGWLRRSGGAAAAIALLALAAGAGPARADIPSEQLLDELRERLLEDPECHPNCASSPRMRLEIRPRSLSARIELQVDVETAVPLPGGARNWVPEAVLVDGGPAEGMMRDRSGVLWLQLSPGRHQVVVSGRLPERDTVELPLPLLPHSVEAIARGWTIHGLHEDGLAEANLQLTRVREERESGPASLEPGELPPFFRITRMLRLGITWQVTTVVTRFTPADAAAVLEVPLLQGESVTAADLRVKDGQALVTMAPGVSVTRWTSVLDEGADLVLRAPDSAAWTEIWRLDVSPIWHVETAGPPYIHQPATERARVREWRPWPGEELTLRIERPEGVEGSTVTADGSSLEVRPGLRATDATLTLRLRSSRGGQHTIVLPEDAELQSVSIGGIVQPIRQEGREVTVPLTPGSRQLELVWREPRGTQSGLRFASSQVDLGIPSVNSEIRFAMSPGRWTLLTGGPRLGPAVLFWPLIAVLALLALGLSRIPLTPLRFHHWLLLGIGLTQVPVWAGALVAGWLLALGWRERSGARVPGRWFNLVQVGLGGATLAALLTLFFSIQKGLLGLPEMQIAGNGSSSELLRWYSDRIGNDVPQPWIFSVPLLVYRIAMLAWALWLAQAIVRWLRWGWTCFSQSELWRPLRPSDPAGTEGG